MSNIRSLLSAFQDEGSVDLEAQSEMKPVAGSYSSVEFLKTNELTGSITKLAHSQNKNSKDKESVAAISKVQKLLVENGVDRRYIQNFLYYGEDGGKVSFQASEGSLYHFITAHTQAGIGQLTRNEIKDIFGQILLGIRALHEKNLVHRDLKTGNILITKDEQGR